MTPPPPAVDAPSARLARRAWGSLEPLHAIGYFAPEPTEAYVELGLHPRLSYFAARSAAFGRATPDVTVATFYVFAPWVVGKALPAAWDVADPHTVQQARRSGVAAALRRLLGEPDAAVLSEALGIARKVCEGLTAAGRALYAAHNSLDWPEDDLMALWHAATLVREHRGDGHVSVLQAAGVDPVESLVLGGLFSHNTDFLKKSRGWSDEEWSAAADRLRDRGLLTREGQLSEEGRAFRQQLEDRTDELAVEGWAHAGEEATGRLVELMAPMRRQLLDSDVLPAFVKGRA